MIRSYASVLKSLVRQHGILIASLWLAQIASVYALRAILIQNPFTEATHASDSRAFPILVMTFSYAFFVLFIGLVFNTQSRTSWLYHLPLPESLFVSLPCALIFIYGAGLWLTVPWGRFTAGIEIVLFGAPLLSFLILKNSRHLTTGIAKAGLFACAIFFLWNTVFLGWSVTEELWRVDAFYLAVFAGLAWLFERRQKRLVLIAPAILAGILIFKIARAETRPPSTFSDAVSDLAFIDSLKTRSEFRKLAIDPAAWASVDSYSLPLFIREQAQREAGVVLTPDEQLTYFKNIDANNETWKAKVLNQVWMDRSGVFPQPSFFDGVASLEPISFLITKPPLRDFLYANWKDTQQFCLALPFEKSARFVKHVFESECGGRRLFNQDVWSAYSLSAPGEFENAVDGYLLAGNSHIASNVRRALQFILFDTYKLPKLSREKYSRAVSQQGLSPELLHSLKKDLRLNFENLLAPLQGSAEHFRQTVEKQTSMMPSDDAAVYALFSKVNGTSLLNSIAIAESERTSFARVRYFFLSPTNIVVGRYRYWMRKILLDGANWPRIKETLAEARKPLRDE